MMNETFFGAFLLNKVIFGVYLFVFIVSFWYQVHCQLQMRYTLYIKCIWNTVVDLSDTYLNFHLKQGPSAHHHPQDSKMR